MPKGPSRRALREAAETHRPSFRRHQRGRAPLNGRPVYGWGWTCSCGQELKSNEPKASAAREHRRHLTAVATQLEAGRP